MSMREYEAKRPWKVAGVDRERYETVMSSLPAELVQRIKEEAHAELLIEQIFGENALR